MPIRSGASPMPIQPVPTGGPAAADAVAQAQRGSLPEPKAGASDLPLSKITGNPNSALWASLPATASRNAVASLRAFRARPTPTLDQAAGRKIAASTTERDRARQLLELADKQARFRAAKVPLLGQSRQTGLDWIKYGRRLNPAAPGGMNGLAKPVRGPAVRGSSADAARVPAGTLEKLAHKALTAPKFMGIYQSKGGRA